MDTEEKPRIIEGNLFIDDRGGLSFVNGFDFKGIKRFYVVENHEARFKRAWHGHKNEAKYMFSVCGDFLIGIVPLSGERNNHKKVVQFWLSSKSPQILYIPPGYFNGFMNIQKESKLMIFSTSTLEESKNDDIRVNWDVWNIWNLERYR